MKRLGVLGTMVWDRIYARDGWLEPIEEWGGISYALAAAVAACPEGWEIVPIVKVGRDLEEQAWEFLRSLPGLRLEPGVRIVPEPNHRVELHYVAEGRRTERITGGVPPWTWDELAPVLDGLDALYVNFITGFEMELETAARVRIGFPGPIHADLHSLLLGVGPGGQRVHEPLLAWRDWLRCFDVVQVNEDELGWLADAWGGDPWRFTAEVVGDAPRLLLVTLAERGAAYVASPAFRPDPLTWRVGGLASLPPIGVSGAARSGRVPVDRARSGGDPTGCGDVWGATCFSRLLAGDGLEDALGAANRAASRNVEHRGTSGLHLFLQGRIDS